MLFVRVIRLANEITLLLGQLSRPCQARYVYNRLNSLYTIHVHGKCFIRFAVQQAGLGFERNWKRKKKKTRKEKRTLPGWRRSLKRACKPLCCLNNRLPSNNIGYRLRGRSERSSNIWDVESSSPRIWRLVCQPTIVRTDELADSYLICLLLFTPVSHNWQPNFDHACSCHVWRCSVAPYFNGTTALNFATWLCCQLRYCAHIIKSSSFCQADAENEEMMAKLLRKAVILFFFFIYVWNMKDILFQTQHLRPE